MSYINTLDVVTLNNNDVVTACVEDVTQFAPELSVVPAIVRPGVTYETLARVGLPTSGFRSIGQAQTPASSVYKKYHQEMFYHDCPLAIDVAAYAATDGTAGDLLFLEQQGALQSSLNDLSEQFYYGAANTGSLGGGFVGVRNQMLSSYRNNPVATPITASNSPTSSTAYAVWLNPQGVSFAIGKQGEIATTPWVQLPYQPAGNGQQYWAWQTHIGFWVGLQNSSEYSVFGITGITQATPLTDNLVSQMLATVPGNRRLGLTFFMSRKSLATLQQSRTAITYQPAGPSGPPAVAPMPDSSMGIPIIYTDGVSDAENNS